MLKKKLISLGIATVFALSSLATPVFAADLKVAANTGKVQIKLNPGKGNGKSNGNKNGWNKIQFSDLDDVKWALNAIEKLTGKGILNGIGQNKYAPKGNVSQLEAIASVLKLTGDNEEISKYSSTNHPDYRGIKPNWGLGYIYMAIEKKILLPEELASFNPNAPAKRHEIAKYILRALDKTDEALSYMDENLPFSDSSAVPKDSVGYVFLVNELGIMTGNNNAFRPMASISRAELAVILDRADGTVALPDTDTRKNNIVFLSANVNDNEITVQEKGKTVTYDVHEDVPVYKDKAFKTINDLEKGDVLQLIFGEDKLVVFIDVLKDAGDAIHEDEISITPVAYNNLSDILQEQVDYLKLTDNYKAYKYDNYIYLIASMGKKNTGGYNIDIENAYKLENTNGEYTVKAVVDTHEPTSTAVVTDAVTYPYSVVRFRYFDNINTVKFVDKDGADLEEVSVVSLDKADTTVKGTIDYINTSSRTIKVEKSNGSIVSYSVPSNTEIILNGSDAQLSDLDEGMNVELEITSGKVTKITANDELDNVSFEAVDYSNLPGRLQDQVDYLKLSKNYKAFEYDNYIYLVATMGRKSTGGYDISVNDVYRMESSNNHYTVKAVVETSNPASGSYNTQSITYPYTVVRFSSFDNIDNVRFVNEDNSKLAEVKPVDLNEITSVEGTIDSLNASTRAIKVKKSNGFVVSFTVPSDAKIIVNGNEENFSDLVKGMNVKVEIADERVSRITAEDNLTEVTGTLTGISLSSSENKITVKVGSSYKTYTVNDDVKITIDGNTSDLGHLTINSELKLTFSNGLLVEIEK
ncbi:MAG: protease complex subunit PrcB family protein [Caulobacteraceae bacterium]